MTKYMKPNGIRPLKRLLAVSAVLGLIMGCSFATHAYEGGTEIYSAKEKASLSSEPDEQVADK
jgi:hypothetical protein